MVWQWRALGPPRLAVHWAIAVSYEVASVAFLETLYVTLPGRWAVALCKNREFFGEINFSVVYLTIRALHEKTLRSLLNQFSHKLQTMTRIRKKF